MPPRDAALQALATRWRNAKPAELANAQSYLIELCEALGVEKPRPAGTGYEFEFPVTIVHRDGSESPGRVDLFNQGRFLLEAKHEGEQTTESAELRLRRAFGQASTYAAYVPGGPPPYLMVLDVGRTIRLWDRWSGSYGGFQGATRTIDLTRLADNEDDATLLRLVWTNPSKIDPNVKSAVVTKEIATKLATLASRLEHEGQDQERVARFLIRCVFTMFAEDVGLLAETPFTRAVEIGVADDDPGAFATAVARLWAAMDEGREFGLRKLLRFNGHFFHDQDVLPLTRDDLAVLLEAARADWAQVEPSIFGTLLTRALDREERHRLGAEFTPRAYVERLVRPTIEEPVRARWTMVQAEVLQLRERDTRPARNKAVRRLQAFLDHLRSLRILDPACGSGNFLYVALSVLKEIELEVIRELESITGQKELPAGDVGPEQFHGIEVKPWAREVAELCLWVGYHQWWRRTHGHTQPPEPVLRDTGTLECRDAVLAWDDIREVPEKSRPDPTPRIEHPVTGDLVPDPEARLPYYEYVGARQAEWPEADFIVGNPPYIGRGRQRQALGDGYVDALRSAYPAVSENADYVMFWWYRASLAVLNGQTDRAGLITTNTITQRHNRAVIQKAISAGVRIHWTAPDHPWVEETGAANVRVAMTVLTREAGSATVVIVDRDGHVQREIIADEVNADLSAHVDIASAAAVSLLANRGISSQGFTLVGEGFRIPGEEGKHLRAADPANATIVRPLVSGRDLAERPRGLYTVDFGLMSERKAREWPRLYDLVRDRVKPQRDAQRRERRKKYWWRYGEPTIGLRKALEGLDRYIATVETSKHRVFQFLPVEVAAEHSVVCIASSEPYHLGVLSSKAHVAWSLAAGGTLEDRPRYQKAMTFDPFPFPDPSEDQREPVARIAERLEEHRTTALSRDDSVTMTGMYNVVEKLRRGEPLTPKERRVHEIAACGVLRDLHDELDRLVADAYGWPWPIEPEEILARLVELHDERVDEERRGLVRWLRPDYQVPRFGDRVEGDLALDDAPAAPDDDTSADLPDWPSDPIAQLTALREAVADRPRTLEQAARRFKGAKRSEVAKHLEALEVLGVVTRVEDGRWQARGGGGGGGIVIE